MKKRPIFISGICLMLLLVPGSGLWSQNYCLDFTSQYVVSPAIGAITNKTLSAWVRLDTLNQPGSGVVTIEDTTGADFDSITYDEQDTGWGFGSHNFNRTAWSGVKETTAGQWVHMAATWENNSFKMYRNGELILTTTAYATKAFASTTKVFFGVRCWNVNGLIDGQIDEVRVWNYVRTQSQIQADMNKELVGNEAGLVTYYKMSNGSGTSISDDSTTSYTGTSTGASWVTLTQTTPAVTTTAVSNVGLVTASSGCVLGDSDWTYTGGVCWNTTGTPTIADDKTADGYGGGTYSSSLTGLSESTTYYVRAYVTSNTGVTSYGDQVSFTTLVDPNGNWLTQSITLYNTTEADVMVRVGDIDNLGYGWQTDFDPFSGRSTPNHAYPWTPDVDDATGTDEIFRPSSWDGATGDGYTNSGVDPKSISLSFDLQNASVDSIVVQMFIDDFQAPHWGGNWVATIDGVSAPFLSKIINSVLQTGPVGKIITFQIPGNFAQYFSDEEVAFKIDDTTTKVADGYAIDFVKLLFNTSAFTYSGIIQGTVTSGGSGVSGAQITATTAKDFSDSSGGNYQLSGVPAGLVLVEVSKTGYIPQSIVVDLIEGTTVPLNFVLVVDPSLTNVSFTDGSGFSSSVIAGQNNQPFGRFQLRGDAADALLSGVVVQLNGERTGMSNFKIWHSSNATFDSSIDRQCGFTVLDDPGNGNSISFTGLSESIPASEVYFFITCDLAGDATGQITGVVEAYERIVLDNGEFSGTINNAPLSNGMSTVLRIPEVTTQPVDGIGTTTAKGNGNIVMTGVPGATAHGICWNQSGTPTRFDNCTNRGTASIGAFSSSITGLLPNTSYYVRAYATNTTGTGYGAEGTFTTNAAPPVAITNAADGISTNGATLNGKVNANNLTTTVTFEYGLTTTYGQTVTAAPNSVRGSAETQVWAVIADLFPNTIYHFRVKGVNGVGMANGEDALFTTNSAAPVVTTNAASAVSESGATLNGIVNANNQSTNVIFEYGQTTAYGNIITANQSPVTGTNDTAVSVSLNSLLPNIVYHFRIVGENATGISRGADILFTTSTTAPIVTTGAATDIGINGATLNGTVNGMNQSTTVTIDFGLTAGYGVSVKASPDTVTKAVANPVSYYFSDLTPNTTYHYRVLAQNPSGISSGSDMTFTTEGSLTKVKTGDITAITSVSAIAGGEVTDDGGLSVISRGVCWSTLQNPTISDFCTLDGSGTGSFSSLITDLKPGSRYYVRAYATNDIGVSYGENALFKALGVFPEVSLINPLNNSTVHGTVSIKAESSVKPDSVIFYIDDVLLGDGVQISGSDFESKPQNAVFNIDNADYIFIDNDYKLKKISGNGIITDVFNVDIEVIDIRMNKIGEVFLKLKDGIFLSNDGFCQHMKIDLLNKAVYGIPNLEINEKQKELLTKYQESTKNFTILSSKQVFRNEKPKVVAYLNKRPLMAVKNNLLLPYRLASSIFFGFTNAINENSSGVSGSYNYTINWNTLNYPDGLYQIKVMANDDYGREFFDEIEVLISNFQIDFNAVRKEDQTYTYSFHFGELSFSIFNPNDLPVVKYTVFRSAAGAVFEPIMEIDPSDVGENAYIFQDRNISVDISYTYKITAFDGNGNILSESELKTI